MSEEYKYYEVQYKNKELDEWCKYDTVSSTEREAISKSIGMLELSRIVRFNVVEEVVCFIDRRKNIVSPETNK